MSGLTIVQAKALQSIVRAVPARTGLFTNVGGREPKNAPGRDLTCWVFCNGIEPIRSGQSSTSLRVTFHVRLQVPMLQEPEDDIDPILMSAAVTVMAGYAGGFTLSAVEADGIDVRAIDIRGMERVSMGAAFGYRDQDGRKYRAVVVQVPILLNDVLTEAP